MRVALARIADVSARGSRPEFKKDSTYHHRCCCSNQNQSPWTGYCCWSRNPQSRRCHRKTCWPCARRRARVNVYSTNNARCAVAQARMELKESRLRMGEVGATLAQLKAELHENAPSNRAVAASLYRRTQGVKRAQRTSNSRKRGGYRRRKGRRVLFNSSNAAQQHRAAEALTGHVQLCSIHRGKTCTL